ncbi:MAG TPA: uroporphyrinogen-III synthase [Hydrogenophaga sp.]|uniref:uroporphyrinogen-III synthase n=1 Tax=Hydrogenophaga sp. TaxID=1904254 RepID=UPI002D09CC79|nr:uroporphyrinogen-III synthase [Hydrogenophaga sp.]HMN93545.1 uroporphyrinogen-III synthase [Hydrogenophaga sp.]HMP10260.1 uroporphyrinogen-III synthase [Hydrogenophaga sp.]
MTRPQEDAGRWVEALQTRGWSTLALPLIDIRAPSSPGVLAVLDQARASWWTFDALMFVSAAAVRHFFTGVHVPPPSCGRNTRFWAPGPGTARELAQALAKLGIPADRLDAPPADAGQFDSEHLWPQVQAQMGMGRRLLVVRGGGAAGQPQGAGVSAGQGREWLTAQCRARGAEVQACMAYERCPPPEDDELRQKALDSRGPWSVWLFSSSEAVTNLRLWLPGFTADGASALATHPRIAETATMAGFARVLISRPALPDVLAALESQWP